MATKELDRWLLNRGPYPEMTSTGGMSRMEPTLTEQGRQAFKDLMKRSQEQAETVQLANTSHPATLSLTNKSVQFIRCELDKCHQVSERIGAQDFCDVYKCEKGHITRYEVGRGMRLEWPTNS